MRPFFSLFQLFILVSLIHFEYIAFTKICQNGYTGINCSIAICAGYTLCKNETICTIKRNKHLCVCQFFDNKGVYREIEKCLRKYIVPNGICFLTINGQELCECAKGWEGYNCGNIHKNHTSSNAISNIYKKKLNIFQKLKYSCRFIDKYNNNVEENCYNQYNIINGVCYLMRTRIFPTCACVKGWEGGDFDCEIATCNKYDGCQNDGTCYIENNRHICSCAEGYYGDHCEGKCNISCGVGKIIINLDKNACECLCSSPYISPDCKLPTYNTTQTPSQNVTIDTSVTVTKNEPTTIKSTSSETTSESTAKTESTQKTESSTPISIKTNTVTIEISTKYTTMPTIVSLTSEATSTITPLFNTTNETKFTSLSTEKISTTTPFSATLTNISALPISTVPTTTKDIPKNNSFTISHIKLEFISIPIVIAFGMLVIGLIYYYRNLLISHIGLKMNRFRNSNYEL